MLKKRKERKQRKKRKEKNEDIIKLQKAKGLEHTNHKNILIPARVVGPDCRCKRYKCFTKIDAEHRQHILNEFNSLSNKNDQDAYLMRGIASANPKRSTVKSPQKFRIVSYTFKIRMYDNLNEVPVCLTAFCNIHGVTKGRIRRLQDLISKNVLSRKDMRGSHKTNRYKKTPDQVLFLIRSHIESFKTKQSHYSLRKNPICRYLPEDLSVHKMYNLFLKTFQIQVSYIVYWTVFKHEYNLKFGLPSTDTCAFCDSQRLKIQIAALEQTKEILRNEHKLHLLMVDKFKEIKRKEKIKAQEGKTMCLTFDYMQNLPLPHIRTSDVFFCRQLWLYVFGIHNLGKNQVVLNSYLETEGKKGQNDVTSLLLRYFNTHEIDSNKLVLISDGCSGQNKNYIMVYFLYFLVHVLNIFSSIKYIFPIRGHTYLPNDQDFSLIGNKKKKATAEVPEDWNDIMETARRHPSPFQIDKINHSDFFIVKETVSPYFLRQSKPAMKLKAVRMLKINKEEPYVFVRYTFTGPWHRIIIRNKKKLPVEFTLKPAYETLLPLNPHKVNDLTKLFQYLSNPNSHNFYKNLLETSNMTQASTSSNNDLDNEDNSSGVEEE